MVAKPAAGRAEAPPGSGTNGKNLAALESEWRGFLEDRFRVADSGTAD